MSNNLHILKFEHISIFSAFLRYQKGFPHDTYHWPAVEILEMKAQKVRGGEELKSLNLRLCTKYDKN